MAKSPIKRLNKTVPDAFHGTELSVAKKIVCEQKFEPGTNEKLYLGKGAYFYEGSLELAENWAKKAGKKKGWKKFGVLQATIQLGACLDLNIPEYYRQLELFGEALYNKMKGNKGREEITPAWVINYFIQEKCGKQLDTIRCPYPYKDAKMFFSESQDLKLYPSYLVICVRNTKNISDISLQLLGLIK